MLVFTAARIGIGLTQKTAGATKSPAVFVIRDYVDALLVAGLAALLLVTFVVRPYYIPSISMIPTLDIGDVLLVDEFSYRFHQPQAGNLAVFIPPIPNNGDAFIKRVIGVPGDRIAIRDGVVYRNGIALREPYENQPPSYDLAIRNYDIYVNGVALDPRLANIPPRGLWQSPDRVPKGFFFMLGDNRNYSDDSHVWGFAQLHGVFAAGPLSHNHARASFAGRAIAVFWPLARMAVLQ